MDLVTTVETVDGLCTALPGAVRTQNGDYTVFSVDESPFAFYPGSTDFPRSFAFLGAQDSVELLQDERIFCPPFMSSAPWLGMNLDGKATTLTEVESVLSRSHELATSEITSSSTG